MKQRSTRAEKLDNLSLQGKDLVQAFSSLSWINRWLGNTSSTIMATLELIKQYPSEKPVHIVDLACGGGDIIVALSQKLDRMDRAYHIRGIDGNPNALAYCAERTKGNAQISYQVADILDANFEIGNCDILISSHFIYHFTSTQLSVFLTKNIPQISTAVIFSELERHPWALWLFKSFGRLLPISKIAYQDGCTAIQRAFTKPELRVICERAGLKHVRIRRVLFFRLQMILFTNGLLSAKSERS